MAEQDDFSAIVRQVAAENGISVEQALTLLDRGMNRALHCGFPRTVFEAQAKGRETRLTPVQARRKGDTV